MTRRGTRQDLSNPLGVLGERAMPCEPVQLRSGVRSEDVTPHEAVLWARGDGPGRLLAQVTAGAHVGRVQRGPLVDASSDFTGRIELTELAAGRPYDAALWFESADGTRGEVGQLCFRTAPLSRSTTTFAWVADSGGDMSATYAAVHRTNPDLVLHLGPEPAPEVPTLRALHADVPFVAVDEGRGFRRVSRGPLLEILADATPNDRRGTVAGAAWTVVAGGDRAARDLDGDRVVWLGADAVGGTAPAGTELSGVAFGRASIRADGVLSASLHDTRGEVVWRG